MTKDKHIPVCIVGAGFGKRVLLPVCEQHPYLQVVSMVVNKNIPEDITDRIRIFTDLGVAMEESKPELVLIASPHVLHERQVSTALDAGINVLCEKPLALSYEAARELDRRCKEFELIGAVDYNFRFIPPRAYLSDLVHSGEIGSVMAIYISFFRNDFGKWPSRWYYERNQGGGMLQATGSHLVDSARILLPGSVSELTASIYESDGIDTGFTIMMETEDGAVCCIAVSHQAAGEGKHLIEVRGTNGSLFLKGDGSVVKFANGEASLLPVPESYLIGFGEEKWIGNPRLQPTARVVDALVSAMLSATPLEALSFSVAADNQRLIDAAWESHRTRRRVCVDGHD